MTKNAPADPVTDPTDFSSSQLPALFHLDSALRCQVCKDFFTTPVTTSCAHTFCSLCIRRCLAQDNGRCPACRAEDQPSKLRRNGALEEAVDAWKKAREDVLGFMAKVEEAGKHSDESREARSEGKRRTRNSKRKISDTDMVDDVERHSVQTRSTKLRTTRSSTRRTEQSSQPSTQSDVIDLDTEEEEPGIKRKPSAEDDDYLPEPAPEAEPNDGLVGCPICKKRMKEEAVFQHLDRCGQESAGQPASASSPSKKSSAQRNAFPPFSRGPLSSSNPASSTPQSHLHIPHLNPGLVNDNGLRKKLKDTGIPSWGSRQLLIRRHAEWANLWNANCDALRPRSKRELLSDLDQWERSQGGAAQGQAQLGGVSFASSQTVRDKEVMAKDFDTGAWGKRNKSQFSDLISQAKKGRAAATAKPVDEQQSISGDTANAIPPIDNVNGTETHGEDAKTTETNAEPMDPDRGPVPAIVAYTDGPEGEAMAKQASLENAGPSIDHAPSHTF